MTFKGKCNHCLRYTEVFRSGKIFLCLACARKIPKVGLDGVLRILTRIAGQRLTD